MSISNFISNLIHHIFNNCFISIFVKRRINVHHQNHKAYARPVFEVKVAAVFQRHVPTAHLNRVQVINPQIVISPIQHYQPRPVILYNTPQPIQHQHLPEPRAFQAQPNHMHGQLQQQRTLLQNENEQLFMNLTQRGYFMARQPSPVVMSSKNAELQYELSNTRQKLQQIFQFANDELFDVEVKAREVREYFEDMMANVRKQLQIEGAHEKIALQEQYNHLAGVEGSLILLEQKFQQYLGELRKQPKLQQSADEVQLSILLSDIERLNRQKNVLHACRHGGVDNAFELQQLLDGFENEYQDLMQKFEKSKKDLIQAEESIADFTNHLLDISQSLKGINLDQPIHRNFQHRKVAQVVHEVPQEKKQMQRAEIVPASIKKLQDAADDVREALNKLLELSARH